MSSSWIVGDSPHPIGFGTAAWRQEGDKQNIPAYQEQALRYVGAVEEAMVDGFPFKVALAAPADPSELQHKCIPPLLLDPPQIVGPSLFG